MPLENTSLARRNSLLALATLPLWGCTAHTPSSSERFGLSAEDEALRKKFRGIPRGGELLVSATYDTDMRQSVFQPNGKLFGPLLGGYSPKKKRYQRLFWR